MTLLRRQGSIGHVPRGSRPQVVLSCPGTHLQVAAKLFPQGPHQPRAGLNRPHLHQPRAGVDPGSRLAFPSARASSTSLRGIGAARCHPKSAAAMHPHDNRARVRTLTRKTAKLRPWMKWKISGWTFSNASTPATARRLTLSLPWCAARSCVTSIPPLPVL